MPLSQTSSNTTHNIIRFPSPPSPSSSKPKPPPIIKRKQSNKEREEEGSQEMDIVGSEDEGDGKDGEGTNEQEEVEEDQLGEGEGEGLNEVKNSEEEEGEGEDLPVLHVEVRLLPTSRIRFDLIKRLIHSHLNNEYETLLTNSEVFDWREVGSLEKHVERIWIAECSLPTLAVPLTSIFPQIHIYQPLPDPTSTLFTSASSPSSNPYSNSDDEEEPTSAATVSHLPNRGLDGIWDNLIYEDDVKNKLLGYIYSTIMFSDAGVDFNVVSWNRVVLLHGPPGTGKTSLCRALAQKLSIRLSERYSTGKLVEINSHSLFSKWFSESGKLVQKLFSNIMEMLDDQDSFVVVLIDEVESLTAARAGAMSGKEPSDALRVVNALLTQLDKLKTRTNCLVMTTSNLSTAIDNAFIDRADIKQYIGLPPPQAVYWILQGCLREMIRANLTPEVTLMDWQAVELLRSMGTSGEEVDKEEQESRFASLLLYDLAHLCQGMSGRTLRRLPVLSHAHFIRNTGNATKKGGPKMEVWIRAMMRCVSELGKQMDLVEKS